MILAGKHNIHSTTQYQLADRLSEADVARFWAKVAKSDGCWLWTASSMDAYDHGQFTARWDGKQHHLYAHRVSWELSNGPIPDSLYVLHNCPGGDNPKCVRPTHLFLGTQATNLDDARQKGTLVDGLGARTLTDAEYAEILTQPYRRGSGIALARKFGVTKTTISRIRNGHQGSTYHNSRPLAFPAAVRGQAAVDAVLERVPSVQIPIVGELHVGESVGSTVPPQLNSFAVTR